MGLKGNSGKVSCGKIVQEAARLIRATGRTVCGEAETARVAGLRGPGYADLAELAKAVDLLLVFGGDGTLLRAAREIAGSPTPILGINIGSLGFLTAVPSAELAPALRRVWQGQFQYEARALLQARATSGGKRFEHTALNEIVIGRGNAFRLIELEVAVNGDALARYRCDGLIISTPTGSTAYSLAAGGAVVFPTAEVIELTPICPHTLSNRSLILPQDARIEVTVVSPTPSTFLSADGSGLTKLAAGDRIIIQRSRRSIRLMHLAGTSFCDTLRRKLHWRGATI